MLAVAVAAGVILGDRQGGRHRAVTYLPKKEQVVLCYRSSARTEGAEWRHDRGGRDECVKLPQTLRIADCCIRASVVTACSTIGANSRPPLLHVY